MIHMVSIVEEEEMEEEEEERRRTSGGWQMGWQGWWGLGLRVVAWSLTRPD